MTNNVSFLVGLENASDLRTALEYGHFVCCGLFVLTWGLAFAIPFPRRCSMSAATLFAVLYSALGLVYLQVVDALIGLAYDCQFSVVQFVALEPICEWNARSYDRAFWHWDRFGRPAGYSLDPDLWPSMFAFYLRYFLVLSACGIVLWIVSQVCVICVIWLLRRRGSTVRYPELCEQPSEDHYSSWNPLRVLRVVVPCARFCPSCNGAEIRHAFVQAVRHQLNNVDRDWHFPLLQYDAYFEMATSQRCSLDPPVMNGTGYACPTPPAPGAGRGDTRAMLPAEVTAAMAMLHVLAQAFVHPDFARYVGQDAVMQLGRLDHTVANRHVVDEVIRRFLTKWRIPRHLVPGIRSRANTTFWVPHDQELQMPVAEFEYLLQGLAGYGAER